MDIKAIAMGLSFALIWSSAFTSARIIVQNAPPLGASSLRFFIAGTLCLILAVILRQSFRLTVSQWRSAIVFGICQNALYLGLFFVAMQRIEASLAAILASSMPLLVALAAALFQNEKLGRMGAVGLCAGFSGVVFIMIFRLQNGIDPLGIALCFIGVIALTIATLSVRNAMSGGNLMVVLGYQMLVGATVLFPAALWFETYSVTFSPELIIAFTYTILAPGITATWIWFLLVDRIGATKAATFHFLNPFFGVSIAAIILSESLTLRDIIGVAIIMMGILLVQRSRITATPS